ncbi:hypothetical protein [Azospirillum palustre]
MSEKDMPPLGETWRDRSLGLVKGAVGLVPVAGGILAELVGVVIPNQRLDRLEDYVRRLNDRLSDVDADEAQQRLSEPEAVDLFEDGATQAVRALSEERKEYIANIVGIGLKGEDKDRIEAKRVLAILREIDDDQVIILFSYMHENYYSDEFRERHSTILDPVFVHMQSSQEEIDAAALHELARNHLVRFGLLRPSFSRPRSGQLPEFDDRTGMIKSSGYELTSLGRMLLCRIGLAEPGEL